MGYKTIVRGYEFDRKLVFSRESEFNSDGKFHCLKVEISITDEDEYDRKTMNVFIGSATALFNDLKKCLRDELKVKINATKLKQC